MTATFTPRTIADAIPRSASRTTRITTEIATVLGFTLLTALLAQVSIHLGFTPVPITGQTLGVLLAGTALGWSRGALSQGLYWVLGIVMPFPWFAVDKTGSSIHASWKVATGPTAGYLAGFVVAAAVVGYLAEREQDRNLATSLPAMLFGTAVIYVFGVAWLAHSLGVPVANGKTNAIGLGLTPFVIGDSLKVLIAGAAAPLAWKFVKRANPKPEADV